MSEGTRNLRLSMHGTVLPGNRSTITCDNSRKTVLMMNEKMKMRGF